MESNKMGKMITPNEAIAIVRKKVMALGTENIDYQNSHGRVLAEDIFSDLNFPPFNKSAMDGYACRKVDLPGPLSVLEEIPAGKSPTLKVTSGTCSKIMTGAEVPEGADTVIMKEYVEMIGSNQIRFLNEKSNTNICLLGEDVRDGDKVLQKGTLLKPAHLAILAGVGRTNILAFRQPTIGIISTGSELVEPGIKPAKAQIRNTNGPQTIAQINSMNLVAEYLGIVEDDQKLTAQKLLSASEKYDLVIISGGISVGDYDYVPEILSYNGFELLITEIASKPGKHTIVARKNDHYILGLPGNPVSSFVQMEVIGKILIYSLMGHYYRPLRIAAKLGEDFRRKKADRFEFIPITIDHSGEVELLPYHGSAHINALCNADAIMEIPLGITQINKGETVYVRPL